MGAALVLVRYPLAGVVIDSGDGCLPQSWWFLAPCCEGAGPQDLCSCGGKCTSHAAAAVSLSWALRLLSQKEKT